MKKTMMRAARRVFRRLFPEVRCPNCEELLAYRGPVEHWCRGCGHEFEVSGPIQ